MSNMAIGGFRPVGTLSGSPIPQPIRFEVASGYGTGIFTGDVATLVTAGVIQASGLADTDLIIGVIRDCSYVQSGRRIPSPYIPASTTYTPTARGSINSSYVWVWVGTDVIYEADLASHANTNTEAKIRAAIGANMDVTAGAGGNTTFGVSSMTLDGNPIAGTANFRIIGVSPRLDNDLTSANAKVLCCINEGAMPPLDLAGI